MLEDEPEKVPDTAGAAAAAPRHARRPRGKLPMSASVSVNRDEFGAILQDAIDGLPEELREARWLLKERDAGDRAGRRTRPSRLIDAARVRAERMVEKNEVVREARRTAEEIVEDAERQAAARSGTRPRTTSTASSPRSRSSSTGRCSRCRRAGSGSRCTRRRRSSARPTPTRRRLLRPGRVSESRPAMVRRPRPA